MTMFLIGVAVGLFAACGLAVVAVALCAADKPDRRPKKISGAAE